MLVGVSSIGLGGWLSGVAEADVWVTTDVQLARAAGNRLEEVGRKRIDVAPSGARRHIDDFPWLYRYREIFGVVERVPWSPPLSQDSYRFAKSEEWRDNLYTVTTSPGWWDRVMQVKDLAMDVKSAVEHAMSPDWMHKAKVLIDGYEIYGDIERLGSDESVLTRSGDFVVTWPNPFYDHLVVTFDARSTDDKFLPPVLAPRSSGDRSGAPPTASQIVEISLAESERAIDQPRSNRALTLYSTHVDTERDTDFWPNVHDDGSVGGFKEETIEHSRRYSYVLDLRRLLGENPPLAKSPLRIPFFFYISEDTKDRQVTHVLNVIVRQQELPPITVTSTLDYWRKTDGELGGEPVRQVVLWTRTQADSDPAFYVDPPDRVDPIDLWRGSDGRFYTEGKVYDWITIRSTVTSDRPVSSHAEQPRMEMSGGPIFAGSTRAKFETWSSGAVQREFVFPAGPEAARRHRYVADGTATATYTLDVAELPAKYEDAVLTQASYVGEVTKTIAFWTTRVVVRDCDCGTGSVVVPDVVGMGRSDAFRRLSDVRLAGEDEKGENGVTAANVVASQSPSAGARVPERTPVRLRFSEAPTLVSVPDLVGRPLEDARRLLKASNLRLSGKFPFPSPPVVLVVREQSPAAGSRVATASRVSVEVAEEVAVPNVDNLFLKTALGEVERARLVAVPRLDLPKGISRESIEKWIVRRTTPSSGVRVAPGSRVEVWAEPWFAPHVPGPAPTADVPAAPHPAPAPSEPAPAPPASGPSLPPPIAMPPVVAEVRVAVPDLKGLAPDEAIRRLEDLGLKSAGAWNRSDLSPRVTAQNPAAGTLVARGTPVGWVAISMK
jgi:beta-lactam-binding protein with PASTA domain